MLRDGIIKHLPNLSRGAGIDPAFVGGLVDAARLAKPFRLDGKALALIDSYIHDLGEDGYSDMMQNARIGWPLLWIEMPLADMGTVGAVVTQSEDGRKDIACFIEDPDRTSRIPPIATCTFWPDTPGSYGVTKTPIFDLISMTMSQTEAEEMVEEMERQSVRVAAVAGVLSILIDHGVVQAAGKPQPISRLKRQSF